MTSYKPEFFLPNYKEFTAAHMTLRSCGVRMSPLSMPTLSEIDVNDVASVSTNEFSSPGVLCDDQISTQT